MPQSPNAANVAINDANAQVFLKVDANGNLRVAPVTQADARSTLNITAATVVSAVPGSIVSLFVVVAGSAAGSLNDCATTGAAAAANKICALPTTAGQIVVNWPALVGIVVTPGTGQTIAIVYELAV